MPRALQFHDWSIRHNHVKVQADIYKDRSTRAGLATTMVKSADTNTGTGRRRHRDRYTTKHERGHDGTATANQA
jgi:hypothetical protein